MFSKELWASHPWDALGQQLSRVAFESGNLPFELESPVGLAVWEGEVRGSVIEGGYTQSGIQGTFRLERVEDQAPAIHKWEGHSVPHHREEVTLPTQI